MFSTATSSSLSPPRALPHTLAFSPSLVLRRTVAPSRSTRRNEPDQGAVHASTYRKYRCQLPAFRPSRPTINALVYRIASIETRLLWLFRISQLASRTPRCVTPSSCVISDGRGNDERRNRSTNRDYIWGSLETPVDKSQRSWSACDQVYEFISKLGNCRISINN